MMPWIVVLKKTEEKKVKRNQVCEASESESESDERIESPEPQNYNDEPVYDDEEE